MKKLLLVIVSCLIPMPVKQTIKVKIKKVVPLVFALLFLCPFLSYASGPQVLASGTTTLANSKLSLAASYAFFDLSTDLTQYVGEQIEICNKTATIGCIRGIISTVGTGETYGTPLTFNGTFDSGTTGWTNLTGCTVASVAGGYSNNCLEVTMISVPVQLRHSIADVTVGKLILGECYLKSGTSGNEIVSVDLLTNIPPYRGTLKIIGTTTSDWVKHSDYGTVNVGTSMMAVITKSVSSAGTFLVDEISFKQVLTPSTTGHWIKSIPGATDGVAWSYKHASFNPNDSAGFTYRILSTNIPGKQIASGTVSATDVKLATVDGGAMVEITGVDLSPYAGDDAGGPVTIINPKSTSAATMTSNKYLLCLYDSSSRVACGYVGAAGGGEALGDEKITSWTQSVLYPYETLTQSGTDITSAINTSSWGFVSADVLSTSGQLLKIVYNLTLNSGAFFNYYCGLGNSRDQIGDSIVRTIPVSGSNIFYRTYGNRYYLFTTDASVNFSTSGTSIKQVTDIATTGVHLHSTPNATDRKMKLTTSGFNPNAVTSYKIYRTY